jgi:hypothetical protein
VIRNEPGPSSHQRLLRLLIWISAKRISTDSSAPSEIEPDVLIVTTEWIPPAFQLDVARSAQLFARFAKLVPPAAT